MDKKKSRNTGAINIGKGVNNSAMVVGDHNVVHQYIPVDNLPSIIEKILKSTSASVGAGLSQDAPESQEAAEKRRLKDAIGVYIEKITSQLEMAKGKHEFKNPYKALQEFDLGDISLFFGRDHLTRKLLKAVTDRGIIVLHGKSGAGKSSLLKAGLRPQLLANQCLPIFVRPQKNNVDEAIKRAILPNLEQSPFWMNSTLHDFLQEIVNQLNGRRLVIILDQFEEVFTLQSAKDRDRFVRQLSICLDDDLLQASWLISIRGEYLSELATFDPPINNPIARNILLPGLGGAETDLAIRQPALSNGIQYEDGLVETIIQDLGATNIHPPEIQIVCSALYESVEDKSILTGEMYKNLGGAKGILQEHFNNVMTQKIPRDRQVLAHRVISALVNSEGIRVFRSKSEILHLLENQNLDLSLLEDVLSRLIDSHLVNVEEDNNPHAPGAKFELSHDYLVDKIELDLDSQNRKFIQELIDYKIKNYKRNSKLLLSHEELEFIVPNSQWLTLTDEQKQLIEVSVRKAQESIAQAATLSTFKILLYFLVMSFATWLLVETFRDLFLRYFALLFWGYLLGFAILGFFRGWVKEMLAVFGGVTGLATIRAFENYVLVDVFGGLDDFSLFLVRSLIILTLVCFGYAMSYLPDLKTKASRTARSDAVLGALLGGVNGYLVAGSLCYYYFDYLRNSALYISPAPSAFLIYMPPSIFGEPGIYFAVIEALIFTLIIFLGGNRPYTAESKRRFVFLEEMRKKREERNQQQKN